MARPLNPRQRQENAAFLKALAEGGNVRDAARAIGMAHGTMQHRRRQHPLFAHAWDAALATAQSRLQRRGGAHRPRGTGPGGIEPRGAGAAADAGTPATAVDALATAGPTVPAAPAAGAGADASHRTRGGEPVVVQRRDGRLQLRRAQPGKLTREAEQAFLSALSVTANVTLAAQSVGASERAFYRRRRRDPGFAREMQMALEEGYERLEMALIESFTVDAHAHDDWTRNDRPAMPEVSAETAMHLLWLHHRTVTEGPSAGYLRQPYGVSDAAWEARRAANYTLEQARLAERLQMESTDRAIERGLKAVARRKGGREG